MAICSVALFVGVLYAFEVIELAGYKTQTSQATFGYIQSSVIILINTYNFVVQPLEFRFSALTPNATLRPYFQPISSICNCSLKAAFQDSPCDTSSLKEDNVSLR